VAAAVLLLVPSRVDQAIGNQAWEMIDKQWFVPTQHGARCEALGRRFEHSAHSFAPTVTLRPLACRRSQDGASGFNAFALPNGQIVLMDGLIEAFNDDQLMVILGHELAHVRHRHGMQALMRQLGVLAVAGAVLGDFSTVAATTLATLRGLAYSRDAEREADTEALRFMASAGLPPALWIEVWDRMALEVARSGSEPPTWLSTHPQISERRRLAE
jgi:Zn-dependent protease with chaperone function